MKESKQHMLYLYNGVLIKRLKSDFSITTSENNEHSRAERKSQMMR